jgi:hypothetical protein
LDGYLLPINKSQIGELQAQARVGLSVIGLLSLGDSTGDILTRFCNDDAVHHERPFKCRRERVARLVAVG